MRDTLDFYLNHWLAVQALLDRPRFAEHSSETFASVLDTCERIAREKFAPFNRLADTEEPRVISGPEGDRVQLPQATHEAVAAYVESGMLAAAQDAEIGGLQLPCVVEMAANAFFSKASVALSGYAMLTSGNANLLMAHGTPAQREVFALNLFSGRWFGTMCLSEPQAGSSLSDVATRAVPDEAPHGAAAGSVPWQQDPLGPRYRLRGNKMWISAGEHELTENIVHLVLAKIPGDDGRLPPGTRGISLFIVPKKLVDATGALTGERNDVSLAGLNHKLGYRGTTNTLLNFGEGRHPVRSDAGSGGGLDSARSGERVDGARSGERLDGARSGERLDGARSGERLDGARSGERLDGARSGAVGYLVGAPGDGLRCMFHMMNEARIGVGLGAVMLGFAGYEASLDYARQRPQGRAMGPDGKNPATPQIPIIRHADVRRMLLAQKSYVEGGLALALYCARLVDEQHTGEAANAAEARTLLEVLTPIAKSWPSEWCLEANSLAIQVLGGYGYTRDFPVEQHWRDNRLNMIHEGTHGIQALDLLGRKVVMDGGAALRTLAKRINTTVEAAGQVSGLAEPANALAAALQELGAATKAAWATGVPEEALANATPYLQAFGHVVVAWIWLDVALAASHAAGPLKDGKLAAMRYFFAYELPKIDAWLAVVSRREPLCREIDDDAF